MHAVMSEGFNGPNMHSCRQNIYSIYNMHTVLICRLDIYLIGITCTVCTGHDCHSVLTQLWIIRACTLHNCKKYPRFFFTKMEKEQGIFFYENRQNKKVNNFPTFWTISTDLYFLSVSHGKVGSTST